MAFDTGAFMIAGTAIAIAGVGLYIWDTRGKDLLSGSSQAAPQNSNNGDSYFGGRRSRKHRRTHGGKTKKH